VKSDFEPGHCEVPTTTSFASEQVGVAGVPSPALHNVVWLPTQATPGNAAPTMRQIADVSR
jgi:hypothetical protein